MKGLDNSKFYLFVFKAASSCLRYLMAVQNHLLSNTILIKPDDNDDSDSSLQGETLKVQVNTKFYSSMALSSQCACDTLFLQCICCLLVVLFLLIELNSWRTGKNSPE